MSTLSDELPSLYDTTGNITDINTLLINRNVLRQLEADVERYQWLRDPKAAVLICPYPLVIRSSDDEVIYNEELDALVDSAMKGKP